MPVPPNVIVAFREGEPDRHCILTQDACIIGRSPDADLILPHTAISRHHATIEASNGQISIIDHDSTNGIFLNGEQVKQATIKKGDFLTLGPYTMVLRALDDAEDVGLPNGKTVCLGHDAVRELHDAFLEKHSPKYFSVFCKAALLLGGRKPLDKLLGEVLALIIESLPAHRGAIVIHADELGEPRLAATCSPGSEPGSLPLSKTLIDYVLRTGTALLTEDALVDPRFSSSDTVINQSIGAAMCAPLCGARRTVGAFYVDTGQKTSSFSERELEFLTAISRLIGMAIENKLLDEAMAKQERLAVLGQAIAGISHDVKSVLSGIKGGVDLLQAARESMDPDKIERACRIVGKSADRVESYLSDLVAFVSNTEISRSPTYINGLIRDVLDVVRPHAKEHGVELIFQGGGFETANIDGPQVHRVLVNIVRNAVDACRKDGGTVTVSVTRKADALMLHISDTGVGIASEDIPRLSEPFFTTKGSGGTGLGLAISFRIIEQHGGRVIVNSESGRGSIFTIVLPKCASKPAESPAEAVDLSIPDATFKKCPSCGHIWTSQDDFLVDPELAVAGYQAHLEQLPAGLFLFDHSCGTTLAVPTGDFAHLYDGPVYKQGLTDTDKCPGLCHHKERLDPCPAQCKCAYVREILQLIRLTPEAS